MRGVRRIRPGETFEVCGAGKTLDLMLRGKAVDWISRESF